MKQLKFKKIPVDMPVGDAGSKGLVKKNTSSLKFPKK